MPIAWGRHDKRQIFLNVAIVDASTMQVAQNGTTLPHVEMFKALVDTGASGTCITPQTAAKVGLSPIGKVPVQGVGGIKYHNNYLFYLGFTVLLPTAAIAAAVSPPIAGQLYLLPNPIQGAEIDAGGMFDVLMGMDVISSGSLKIEGDGTFSWAW
jgi:Aspartyl protease